MFHLVLFAAIAACDDGSDDSTPTGDTGSPADTTPTGDTGSAPEVLAITGTYLDGFGSDHVITNETWTQSYAGYEPLVFHVASFDNTDEVVIAHNDELNTYGGGAWSRFDWSLAADGHLYYCQSAFDAPSEQAAVDTPRPDDTDPATRGCGGFSWTDLTP